jgi:SAM-dependent methyltransferase
LKFALAVRNRLLDVVDTLLGRRHDLVPPRSLVFVGAGDFLSIGREFIGHFRQLAGLRPKDDVLDVGSGIGRMAVPLTEYLSASAVYEGFDIVAQGITWCQRTITPRFPNFRFQLADVRNREYNPGGTVRAEEFRFPYPDDSFDFVFLTSVFTHMLPTEIDNYVSEVQRVLRPGGRSLATWFLINEDSEALMRRGRSAIDFRHALPGYTVANPAVPEEAVAYAESAMLAAYRRHALELMVPIQYGSWCGRSAYLSFQDICVFRKP